jgi:putative PIN family toxin of toxin-antitoxin system
MIRVCADTNIYISALIFGGLPGVFLDVGLRGGFHLVLSRPLLDELDEKLREKFMVGEEDAAGVRARLEKAALVVEPDVVLNVVTDDPDDNRVLECAMTGRADVIVSGDRHLLRLRLHNGIPIMTARQFLEASGFVS